MITAPCVLAIDLGSSGCKVALVQTNGDVLDFEFEPIETLTVGALGVEQNPDAWCKALVLTTNKLLGRFAGVKILAICASTQGEGTVAVDRQGRVLHPAIIWMDARGGDRVRALLRGKFSSIQGYSPIKLWHWIRITGGAPSISGKDPVGHIAYLRHEHPKIYDKTYKFLNVLDYINFVLTGEMAATKDSALTSWATDNRDLAKIDYHAKLLKYAGLERDKLPTIINSTDVVGKLLPSMADKLGLSAGIPVIAGGIDVSVAAIGAFTTGLNQAHLYMGTSSWIGLHTECKKTDVSQQIASVPCAMPDKYLMVAMQSAAGSNLSFLRDRVLFINDGILNDEVHPDVYRILDEVVSRVPAGARGLLYTPWLVGERSPKDAPHLRAGLLGMSLSHSREDIVRAFMEGVGHNTKWLLGGVNRFLKQPVQELNFIGGGAKSEVWCQIFADILGVSIHQCHKPIEANVRGSALLAGVALKELAFADIPALRRIAKTFEPNPKHYEIYQQAHANFLSATTFLDKYYRRYEVGKMPR